jgi:dienelactone hydrolase
MSVAVRSTLALWALILSACSSGPTQGVDETVASVTLSSTEVSFEYAGETATLVASVRNQSGDIVSGVGVAWDSEDPAVATVSPTGEVTAFSNGSTTITASAGGVSGTARVSVDCEGIFCRLYTVADKTPDVVYGIDGDAHLMTVFEPQGDIRAARPSIVLFAGGGLNVPALEDAARALARYGFVVATARYRAPSTTSSEEFISSVVRGGQDLKAAVRYLRSESSSWRIDPSRILFGGNGTGGVVAASAAYVTLDELTPPADSIVYALGGLEGDQGNPEESSRVAGVFLLAGGLYQDDDSVLVIDSGEPPLYAVHAVDDGDIWIDCGQQGNGSWECGGRALVRRAQSEGILADGTWLPSGGHTGPREMPLAWIDGFMSWARQLLG